jgi:hypothetical protein
MSQLANVIVGLDGLSEAELRTVAQVIAMRTGKFPPSSTGQRPKDPHSAGSPEQLKAVVEKLVVGQSPKPTVDDLVGSPQFQQLAASIVLCSKPLVPGPGRKREMLRRVETVATSWKNLPEVEKYPFHEALSRAGDGSEPAKSQAPGITEG